MLMGPLILLLQSYLIVYNATGSYEQYYCVVLLTVLRLLWRYH